MWGRKKPVSDEEVELILAGLKNGIKRLYMDAGGKWHRSDVVAMLNPITIAPRHLSIDDPRVQAKLKEWEEQGYIKLHRTKDLYFEVLIPFDYVSPWESDKS
jgi:hypothetical protein